MTQHSQRISRPKARCAAKPKEWTSEEIRAVTPFPKPQGAIDKALDCQAGRSFVGPIENVERAMLRQIAETADLIDAGEPGGWHLPRYWLLVPAPADLIDFLSTFEIERGEDLGVDDCREPGEDDEEEAEGDDSEDLEPDHDAEEGPGAIVTEERRALQGRR